MKAMQTMMAQQMAQQMEMQRQMQMQLMAELKNYFVAANRSSISAAPTTTEYSTPVLPQNRQHHSCDLADDEGSLPPKKKIRRSPRHNEPRRSPRHNEPRRSPRHNETRRSPRHNDEPRRSPRHNQTLLSPRHNKSRRSPRHNKLRRSPRLNKPRRSPRLKKTRRSPSRSPVVKKEPPAKKVEQLKRTLSWAKARAEGKRTPKDPKVHNRLLCSIRYLTYL